MKLGKFLFFIFPFLVVFFSLSSKTFAEQEQAHVLFVNQVRGSECCEKGFFENLEQQVETFIATNTPAFFTLRYDVLSEEQYTTYFKKVVGKRPDIMKLGLFIEITPKLAKEAQVTYKGSENNWFEGQNAFLIGYTSEERRKIVDLLFNKFFQIFGYYPQLTTAWMIDTDSLNYMHDKYKVLVHQITREQWGVDSYTLYGGPPHYPYPASKNWAFMPDYEKENSLLIVRQAVNDPLFNYGDTTSAFTSQVNDYLKDKTTEYFTKLINQAVSQPSQKGFVLLGLENSMDEIYQNEYRKQIQYITELKNRNEVNFPSLEELVRFWQTQKTTVYFGRDFLNDTENEAYWITTPFFRARLRIKNDKVLLTDLRLFDVNYTDPYNDYVAKKEGFWISPYLIDGSHWHTALEDERSGLQKLLSAPPKTNTFFETEKDIKVETTHIAFPVLGENGDIRIERDNYDEVRFSYQTRSGLAEILFKEDKILVTSSDQSKASYQDYGLTGLPVKYREIKNGFKLEWLVGSKVAHFLENKCEGDQCIMSLVPDASSFEEIREKQYPFVFPEPIERELSEEKSGLYVHNPYAIANRNPVRIVVVPRDNQALPIILADLPKVFTEPEIDRVSNTQDSISKPIQYIDLYHTLPQSFSVTVEMSPNIKKQTDVFFAPNCKQDVKYCLSHPKQTWWYLNAIAQDKIRKFLSGEQQ